jgi:hypothetical protein
LRRKGIALSAQKHHIVGEKALLFRRKSFTLLRSISGGGCEKELRFRNRFTGKRP